MYYRNIFLNFKVLIIRVLNVIKKWKYKIIFENIKAISLSENRMVTYWHNSYGRSNLLEIYDVQLSLI